MNFVRINNKSLVSLHCFYIKQRYTIYITLKSIQASLSSLSQSFTSTVILS